MSSLSRVTRSMAVFERLERERAESEAAQRAGSDDLARSSTRKALMGNRGERKPR